MNNKKEINYNSLFVKLIICKKFVVKNFYLKSLNYFLIKREITKNRIIMIFHKLLIYYLISKNIKSFILIK